MSDLTTRLDLPLIKPSQAQKHVTHNEALLVLDGLVQSVLESTGAETPPSTPVDGKMYALGANPSGDWDGQGGTLALRTEGAWRFIAPQEGWRAYDKDAGAFKIYVSGDWNGLSATLQNVAGVGIGTTSDSANRLSVFSDASLFSHDGAGHQMKINKSTTGQTASLLFQSNYDGRAEMGLAGDNAFALKVSADGTSWSDVMRADPTASEVEFDMPITGIAVQQAPDDTTAGRLMRADWGYGPGTVLGTVGLAAGVPTGGVIERGSNANGEFTKFADGTQICWRQGMQLDQANANACTGIWTFPSAFVAAPVIVAGHPNPSNATPNDREILPPRASAVTSTDAAMRATRIDGLTDFQSGDFLTTDVIAFGRWA